MIPSVIDLTVVCGSSNEADLAQFKRPRVGALGRSFFTERSGFNQKRFAGTRQRKVPVNRYFSNRYTHNNIFMREYDAANTR